jgi:hypothetical protein
LPVPPEFAWPVAVAPALPLFPPVPVPVTLPEFPVNKVAVIPPAPPPLLLPEFPDPPNTQPVAPE